MPYEHSPSPVAPTASSRLWTAGASGGVAILVMAALAVMKPELAGWLAAGGAAVAVATWLVNRRPPAPLSVAEIEAAAAGDLTPDASLLADVFEALGDPVLIVSGGEADDIAGRRIVLANAAARELFRLGGAGGALLVSVIRDPKVLEAVDEALFGGVGGTVDYVGGGAQERHWRAVVRPLPARDAYSWGAGAIALLALRDETDARRMEMMRVDFLANASHELRTPLASLSGFIETLKGHAKDDPKARDKFLDIMAIQADRMGRLVADLLSLSRIELNEHIAPQGRVDLSRAASDVVDAVSVLSRERGVTIRADLGQGGASVSGDRDEIVQVIQNLIDNALKYSSNGGTVELTIERDRTLDEAMTARMAEGTRLSLATPDREAGQRYAVVTVRDHGPGMAREHLPRLTERFYRVEGQKSGERQGTGLGLAIVRHIIIRHRGGLTVDSALGQGAIFAACFPVAPARTMESTGGPTP
ncbi:sensor histidine kinase [Brevundimonas faecalis]|uniref:histidine kinase n=1 Tax=Brevundimonas faecalis TaxID=947378 RepID=A0ABV2RE43_9CAUL